MRRDGDRRHGQRPPRRADAHGRAARDGDGDDRGHHARGRQAQRPVRRRRAGRAARGPARARLAARRQRRRGRRRACDREEWTGESYSDDEFRELAEVAARAAAAGHGRARIARLVGPGDHGHGHRRAVGGERAQRRVAVRAREAQPARAPRRRTPRRRRRRSCDTCEAVRPFGIALEVHAEETGNGFSADTTGPAYEAARAAYRGRLGDAGGQRRRRRVDPARQRAAGRRAEGRGAARGRHRRLREHPRARRARPARRAREGDRRRGRRSSASTRSAGAERAMADTIVPDPGTGAVEKTGMERVLDGIERLGNKMPDPAILFLWLCLGVILLSQALAWLDVKATYQVVAPPPVPGQETYYGGSSEPVYVTPYEQEPAEAYGMRTETTRGQGPADRRRHPLPVHVVRRQLPQLRRGGDHPGGDDRRRPGRGGRADRRADPQAGRGVLARAC